MAGHGLDATLANPVVQSRVVLAKVAHSMPGSYRHPACRATPKIGEPRT